MLNFFWMTNQLCTSDTMKSLQSLNRINAKHEGDGYFLHSETLAINLPLNTFIAVGAKIMILWNINRSLRLVNGATGIVQDFMF